MDACFGLSANMSQRHMCLDASDIEIVDVFAECGECASLKQGECTSLNANFGTSRGLAGMGGISAMTRYRTFFLRSHVFTRILISNMTRAISRDCIRGVGFCNHFFRTML